MSILRTIRNFEETNDHNRRRGQLNTVYIIHVSVSTLRRCPAERNLRFRISARLQSVREHVNWTAEDWERVLFTMRQGLNTNDRRVRVNRRPNKRYWQCNNHQTGLFNGGSVMFWGEISMKARTEIVSLHGPPLNSKRYIAEILSELVFPFAGYIGDKFILTHYNSRPHVTRIVQNYLNEVNIETLDWTSLQDWDCYVQTQYVTYWIDKDITIESHSVEQREASQHVLNWKMKESHSRSPSYGTLMRSSR